MKWLASILVLGAAVYFLDWGVVSETLSKINPWHFALAVLIILPEHGILAWRWYMIVRDNTPMVFREHGRRFLISVFLSTFSPGSVGGDIYRFFSLRKDSTDPWLLAGAIARERVLGIVGFSVFYLLCYGGGKMKMGEFTWALDNPFDIGALVLGCGLAAVVPVGRACMWGIGVDFVASRPKLYDFCRLVAHGVDLGSGSWALRMLSISLIVCLLWTLSIYIIDQNVQVMESAGWHTFLVFGMVGVLTDLIRTLPITFQGIGIREGIFAYLLTIVGAPFDAAFILAAAAYAAVSLSILAAGAIGMLLPAATEADPAP